MNAIPSVEFALERCRSFKGWSHSRQEWGHDATALHSHCPVMLHRRLGRD